MALTATPAALTADADTETPKSPEWYRWQDATGKWRAARTTVPTDLRHYVMLISGETYSDLMTAAVRAEEA